MSENPYAPPAAVITEFDGTASSSGTAPFFPVSPLKLWVMSSCTFGAYELYWFYRNWKLVREREQSGISPFWRALFGYFFCYAFFKRVREHGQAAGITPVLAAGPLAAAWIVVTLTWKLPDPYALITLASPFFMVPVQKHMNALNTLEAPGHDPNSTFSGWNWAAIVVGGILLVVSTVMAFVMPE